ncbi:MAG: DUF3078 domain-containing protein [Bacteroidetes bacterium]|nr:DUF3078 domain-containing protein [Bacteroidota bacterium]MBS1633117.1 DUF3078 domain-containing protein [Bacteroidota bacterium]
MRKILFISTTTVLFSFCLEAQDATIRTLQIESTKAIKTGLPDTIKKVWKTGGLYNLNVGQGSLSNWAAGGDDFSLTVNSQLGLYGFYRNGKHSWINTLDVSLGYLRTTTLGSRKNDDRFDLLSKYGYALHRKLNISSLFDFRSQFFKGYTYNNGLKTFASDFLAPAYVVLSVGTDYKPTKHLSIFLSPVTSRWVIVKDDSLASVGSYGVDSDKHSVNQLGSFCTINYLKEFNKYIAYRARVDLFSNYRKKPQDIDMYMTNALMVKLAKFFSINWNVDMIYDDNIKLFGKYKTSPALQLKSIIGIGLLVNFSTLST